MGLLAGLFNLGEVEAVTLAKIPFTAKEAMLLPYVNYAAQKHNVEPHLILAHIFNESSFDPKVKRWEYGSEYSFGAMQLLRKTAESLAGKKLTDSELLDPQINIDLGTKYVKQNLDRYNGNYTDAMAAYNAGTARKNEKGQYVNSKGVPNVQKYVDRITTALSMYREGKTPMTYSLTSYLPSVITDKLPETPEIIKELLPSAIASSFWLYAGFGIAGLVIGTTIFMPKGK